MSPLRSEILVVGGVALAVLGVLWWAKNKISAGALNPANPDNVASTAVNSIVAQLSCDPNQTLGGWFPDYFGSNQGLAPGETLDPQTGFIIPASSYSLERDLPGGLHVQ